MLELHQMLPGVAGLAVAGLTWTSLRDRERYRRQRAVLFADCLALFDACRVEQDDVAFASLCGTYRGREVRLEPVVDQVTFRKIPSLWLKVTLVAAVPYRGTFDLLARPRGGEFYSPFSELACELSKPPDWPHDAVIHVDDPALVPDTDIIAPHVRVFADVRMKELLVTPRGVRLVYQISQSERTNYVVLRQLEFDELRLAPKLVMRLLDAAVALHAAVAPPAVVGMSCSPA